MTNWLTNAERRELRSRLASRHDTQRRAAADHPEAHRRALRLKPDPASRLAAILQPWQARDFAALDPAWLTLAGRGPMEGPRRAYLERPRGHSKTTDTAVQVTWILQWALAPVRGLAAAADQDQARLIHAAIGDLVRHNPHLCPDLQVRKESIRNTRTGSELQVISSDVGSSWGQLPDFVICDELCHWTKPELWYSLCSSAAKKPSCVLVVLTNAGFGTGWQWEVRAAAMASGEWYFSSLAGSQAPWITPETLAEQRRLLPPAVYARLWDNVWQHSDGEFVSREEAAACVDPDLRTVDIGRPEVAYVAAIDYAEKHDRTVGVVAHRAGETIFVDRMDVAVPAPGQPVLVQWVEDWIHRTATNFPGVRFVLDEYQLLAILQRWSSRYDLRRFDFAAGKGNHALALALRSLIVHRQVRWPAGCGQLETTAATDDLVTELSSLVLRTHQGGRVRIDHRRDPGCHDDRAFALGAVCLELLREAPVETQWMITPPAADGGFAW